MSDPVAQWAMELQSLAQAGLYYGKDVFDRERYQRIREISAEMMAFRTGLSEDRINDLFCSDSGYQTPKVETRASIIRDGKILLVCEKGKWALPGGWCEFNLSPAENTVKEVKEEAGLDVKVSKLVAVLDRDKHHTRAYAFGIVKFFFQCEILGGEFVPNSETTDSGFFAPDSLPVLALGKSTPEQIAMCFDAYNDSSWSVRFD